MRYGLFITVVAFATVCAASPASPSPPPPAMAAKGKGNAPPPKPKANEDVSVQVAAVDKCAQDCWNESAAEAGCDPNTDDKCLCGPFFDAVTSCVSDICSVGDNLQVLNTLEPLCS